MSLQRFVARTFEQSRSKTLIHFCTLASICMLAAALWLALPRAGALGDDLPAPRALHITPIPIPTPPVTDQQIGQAIDKGAAWLMAQFKNNVVVESGQGVTFPEQRATGADALAVYALLQCGMSSDIPELSKDGKFIKGLLDTLKALPVNERFGTYTRGLRATCLAVLHRPEDRAAISIDVEALLDTCSGGAFNYGCTAAQVGSGRRHEYMRGPTVRWDNSNSQYGLLGVWSAAEIGAEIPNDFWQVVERHWTQAQLADGQWNYNPDSAENAAPDVKMTCAALASLFVCHDYIDLARYSTDVGREPFTPPLARGLAWLEAGDNSVLGGNPYGSYGMERVGLASGFKYFGTHDWYRELAKLIVSQQEADGSWSKGWGPVVSTSYNLLFLSRGRHPILMNKLRFEHYWANRPRDVSRLAEYAGRQLETVFNWQVVTTKKDWDDWTDSPILYIASHEPAKLSDADLAKIRAFVDSGGLLFTQADGGSDEFNEYAEKLAAKLFPEYGEFVKVPPDHPLYTAFTPMKKKARLMAISNGARLLMVHSQSDISQYWQLRASRSHADAFDLGMNLFVYAAGRRDFQNRVATNYIPDPPADKLTDTIKVARVKYAMPTWNAEPYAWKRFANWMGWQTSLKVQTQAVEMKDLGSISPRDVPLAHLTGTVAFDPPADQAAGLKKYVEAGGILFIDACGGETFNDSILHKIIPKAFGAVKFEPIEMSHPLMTASADGMSDLTKPTLRSYAKHLSSKPELMGFRFGKGQVIYSSLDVTNGLLGSQTWGINGYTDPYCLDLMKNLVLWAARGAPEK